MEKNDNFYGVKEFYRFCQDNGFKRITYSLLRSLIEERDTNGFDKVLKKIGKRFWISAPDFWDWMNEKGTSSSIYVGKKDND